MSHLSLCLSPYFSDYLALSGLWKKKKRPRKRCFHDPVEVCPERLYNLQNQITYQFIHSFTPFSVVGYEAIADLVFSEVESRPGHLISCQKWTLLQVNRSPSPLITLMALTGASSILTVLFSL